MSGVPVWQEAVALPWLRPSTAALLALASDPPDGQAVLGDPAAVAHVLRFARPTPGPHDSLITPKVLGQPSLASNAAVLLEECRQDAPNWNGSGYLSPVNIVTDAAADAAAEIARDGTSCSPEVASAVARLAALGWYALAAVDPASVSTYLEAGTGEGWQLLPRRPGTNVGVITRRLAGRWRLPKWAAATIGYLRFRAEDAARLGAPPGLFAVTQAAVWAAERRYGSMGLTDPRIKPDTNPLFGEAERLVAALPQPGPTAAEVEPAPKGLLVRLLNTTAVARRAGGVTWLAEAEDRVDALGDALAELRADFETAVRDAKLAGLAEFAAGASHEINNPLAVISGHAQLLLNQESDPDRRGQLGVIVRQTKRIHDLLQGTLQFARPSRPSPTVVRVGELVEEVAATVRPEAAAKRVTVSVQHDVQAVHVRADARQLVQGMLQVARNAVDAAPAGGWVRLGITATSGRVELTVEDSGPGPSAGESGHLFDPFYSGRSAGRGRGLGLSIAWRLATINGGTVRFEPTPGGPTRFVLSFPAESGTIATLPVSVRKCA